MSAGIVNDAQTIMTGSTFGSQSPIPGNVYRITIAMTWMTLCLLGAMATGFFGIAWFAVNPEVAGPVVANPERVFIELSALLFNPWLAGVLLSAILAAVMSTLSAQLLVCSSALTEDFYRGFVRPRAGHRELVWFGRAMVLTVALLVEGPGRIDASLST